MRQVLRLILVAAMLLGGFACQSPSQGSVATGSLTTAISALPLIVQPDAGTQPIVTLLNSAQKTIRVGMYLLSDREIIDALKAARGRGVDVRIILEAQPMGGGTGNRSAQNDLQAASINVKTGNPAHRLTREKVIVVDEHVALIATFNQTRASFTTNRDYGVIDANSDDVAEIVKVFDADWQRAVPTVSNPNLVWSPANARQRLTALIDDAKQTLDIEMEEMQDRVIEERLIEAVARGVAVRVVMSPAPSGNDANAAGQERIMRGGCQLRFVKTPYIHAKIIIADSARAFVGSQNLATASLDAYRELGILLTDPRMIQVLSETFAHDWSIGK